MNSMICRMRFIFLAFLDKQDNELLKNVKSS